MESNQNFGSTNFSRQPAATCWYMGKINVLTFYLIFFIQMNKDLKSKCCQVDIEESTGYDGLTRQYCSNCKWNILIPMEDRRPKQPSQEDWKQCADYAASYGDAVLVIPLSDVEKILKEQCLNTRPGDSNEELIKAARSVQDLKTRQECAEIVWAIWPETWHRKRDEAVLKILNPNPTNQNE